MQSIMQYVYDHPETVAIIWPVLTALLSLLFGAVRLKAPRLVAFLAAAGLDLPALLRAVKKPQPTVYAQSLYAAYVKSSGGLNFRGETCPTWEELPTAIRGHWQAVADSILGAVTHYAAATPTQSADATPITTTREAGE